MKNWSDNQQEVLAMLELSDKGKVRSTIDNGAIILREDNFFKEKIRENLFRNRIEVCGDMEWSRRSADLTDKDEIHFRHYLESQYHYYNNKALKDALQVIASENEYHPIREWLLSLKWDGTERIRHALPHFLGADEDDYQYECLKLFMTGALYRVMHPGCKFEYLMILVGGQGLGKSTFFRYLCHEDSWFSDGITRLDDEKIYERIGGHWICELAEMMPLMNTKYNESVKAFLSKQYDNYRRPYGTLSEDIPRQSVFGGTSNEQHCLPLDRSGNRRFLPIMCHDEKAETHILADKKASRHYFEQMWAELMVMYQKKELSLVLPKEIATHLIDYQSPFMQEDTWKGLIQDWLESTNHNLICTQMIYNEALNEIGKPKQYESREIGAIMNSFSEGWRYYPNPRSIPGFGKQRGWERVETKSGNKEDKFISIEDAQIKIPFEA